MLDWCCMCKIAESVDHRLLHCEIVSELWSLLQTGWFGLAKTLMDFFNSWRMAALKLQLWKMASTCQIWCIWREWDDRSFEDPEHMLEELKPLFSNTLPLDAFDRLPWA